MFPISNIPVGIRWISNLVPARYFIEITRDAFLRGSSWVGWLVFDVPVRGSLVLIYVAGALCVLAGIGLGTFLATFSKSQQQAQLLSFFINPPIALLSGATTPIEAMPNWMQSITMINPVRHFATIARGIMLKGADVEILYPNFLMLIGFAALLLTISCWRFRKQLG